MVLASPGCLAHAFIFALIILTARMVHFRLQALAVILLSLLVEGLPVPTPAELCWVLLGKGSSCLYCHGVVVSNLHSRTVVEGISLWPFKRKRRRWW